MKIPTMGENWKEPETTNLSYKNSWFVFEYLLEIEIILELQENESYDILQSNAPITKWNS